MWRGPPLMLSRIGVGRLKLVNSLVSTPFLPPWILIWMKLPTTFCTVIVVALLRVSTTKLKFSNVVVMACLISTIFFNAFSLTWRVMLFFLDFSPYYILGGYTDILKEPKILPKAKRSGRFISTTPFLICL